MIFLISPLGLSFFTFVAFNVFTYESSYPIWIPFLVVKPWVDINFKHLQWDFGIFFSGKIQPSVLHLDTTSLFDVPYLIYLNELLTYEYCPFIRLRNVDFFLILFTYLFPIREVLALIPQVRIALWLWSSFFIVILKMCLKQEFTHLLLFFDYYRTGSSFSLLQGFTLGIIASSWWPCYMFAFFPTTLYLPTLKLIFHAAAMSWTQFLVFLQFCMVWLYVHII